MGPTSPAGHHTVGSKLRLKDWVTTAAILVPPVIWAFLNLAMTLTLGHPTTDTRELPYAEVALQGVLALGAYAALPRGTRAWWLTALVPLPIWTLIRALMTGTSPVWAVALSVLLLSPIVSILLATRTTERTVPAVRVAFMAIVMSQLVAFPFNLVGMLADDNAIALDRFSGSLLGRGGYFSSYVVLAGALFLWATRLRMWLKVVPLLVALAHGWVAEVKLIFFVAGVVLATMLVFSSSRRTVARTVPGAVLATFVGIWLSVSMPSSYGLQMDNYGYRVGNPAQGLAQLNNLVEQTGPTADITTQATSDPAAVPAEASGSKLAVMAAVLSPVSDLWSRNGHNALVGVGPSGGLSHLARFADGSQLIVSASRPDPRFREEARLLAGSRQRDQSLATQPESTVNGVVSEVGYVGLAMFLASFILAVWLSLKVFTRIAVGVMVGFAVAFVPLFSLWETPGFWMVVAFGLASVGKKPDLSSASRSATN